VLAANLASFTDGPTGVAANTLYKYDVFTKNAVGASALTTAYAVTTAILPKPGQMQSGGASTTTTVALQWQSVASPVATGYEIQHCAGTALACATGVWAPSPGQIKLGTNATNKVVVTGLTTKTTYQFRVRTINALVPSVSSLWSSIQAKTL
jgi:hypothetical protein